MQTLTVSSSVSSCSYTACTSSESHPLNQKQGVTFLLSEFHASCHQHSIRHTSILVCLNACTDLPLLGPTHFFYPMSRHDSKSIKFQNTFPHVGACLFCVGFKMPYTGGCVRTGPSAEPAGPPYMDVKSSCLGTAFLVAWSPCTPCVGPEIVSTGWGKSKSTGRLTVLQITRKEPS
jgi:hypothetical protein